MSRDEWVKRPNDKKDIIFDWADQMAEDVDTIAASVMTVDPVGLVINSPAASFTPVNATVWVSGGTDNQRYIVYNQITTTAGRIHTDSIVVSVKLKNRQVG